MFVTGHKELSQDVAALVIQTWLEYEKNHGQETSQTIAQAVTDAIRKIGINYRNEEKAVFQKGQVSWDNDLFEKFYQQLKDPTTFERVMPLLPTNTNSFDRAIFILTFKWGMSHRDLEEIFALSEGRMSQMIKSLIRKISKGMRKTNG